MKLKKTLFLLISGGLVITFLSCNPDDPFTISKCIVTGNVSSITTNSASVQGAIVCDGGLIITERGFYWGTSSDPEIGGQMLLAGSGTGSFEVNLGCLGANTTYYIKAYAVNSKGKFFGCEKSFTTLSHETFTDMRDGRTYKTVTIGNQTWFAENLDYEVPTGSFCYNDLQDNCNAYGRLYFWNEAFLAVPQGWHLPTKEEVDDLIAQFNSPEEAYIQLEIGGCSGFDAKFAGIRNHEPYSNYFGLDTYADYFTSTETSSDWVWILDLNIADQKAYVGQDRKNRGFSVRCIKNQAGTGQ